MINLVKDETLSFNNVEDLKKEVNKNQGHFLHTRMKEVSMNEEGLRIEKKNYGLKECGLKSICNRVGIPTTYADRIPTDLLVDSFNRLVKSQPDKPITVNLRKNNVRAIHSDTYMPISNDKIVNALEIPKDLKVKVRDITLGDEFMRIAFTSSINRVEVRKGDIVEVGQEINNSETGYSTFSSLDYLNRLVCTNGATIAMAGHGVRKVHLGYQDFNPNEIIAKGIERMRQSHRYADAFKIMNDKKPLASYLEKLSKDVQASLGKAPTAELVRQWKDQELNMYSIFNEITEVAHTRKDITFPARQNLERIGGRILDNYLNMVK